MPSEAAITVSQLNRRVRALLESGIAQLWVEGEISNLSRPASGHVYFSLKDDSAQVSAAWFRQRQRGPAAGYKNGDRVLAFGRVSIYEARGNYQLIVDRMEPAGEGVLKRRFEALKKKLLEEGLFDEDRKQPLPTLPSRIRTTRIAAGPRCSADCSRLLLSLHTMSAAASPLMSANTGRQLGKRNSVAG